MKTIYLIRHANAARPENTKDFDRPLSERGLSDAVMMGKRLAKLGWAPEVVISSPAHRALSTARLLVPELLINPDSIQTEFGIYEAMTEDIMEIISELPESVDSAMLFGHNPGFHTLADQLSGRAIPNFPTCAVAAIRFETESWDEISSGSGELFHFDFPDN